MTIEDYRKMIEHPMTWVKTPSEARTIKAAILRTIRIVLKDPELAKEYYGRQPMATMDSVIVTSQREDCNGHKTNDSTDSPCVEE